MDAGFTSQNPIVAAAARIRARRELEKVIDTPTGVSPARKAEDAEESLRFFADQLAMGCKRLNAILGARNGVKLVRLEKPLRVRLRFRDDRASLELDNVHQLVRVSGIGLDGEYQFDPGTDLPSLVNLSKVSTEAGYGERLTPSSLLKQLASSAELEPPHANAPGPLQF
jgi:hypothetical protein